MSDNLFNIFISSMTRQVYPPVNRIVCSNIESEIKKKASNQHDVHAHATKHSHGRVTLNVACKSKRPGKCSSAANFTSQKFYNS